MLLMGWDGTEVVRIILSPSQFLKLTIYRHLKYVVLSRITT